MKYRSIGGLVAALLLTGNACPQVITSFAGGSFVFPGNGQPALDAPLANIGGVTLDPAGNLVLADLDNRFVARINTYGTLSVIAGNGVPTGGVHSGDGGPAVNAALNGPSAVAYDSQENLYIAEQDRLSRVSPQGIINTYAGGGTDSTSNGIPALQAAVSLFGSPGLVVDASGAMYFTEPLNARVRKVTPDGTIATVAGTFITPGFSGDGGPATAATLTEPYGLALDVSGNLYIADIGNFTVRKVTPAGIISTLLKNIYAVGLHFDSNGVLYIAGGSLVYKLPPDSSTPI